MSYRTLKIVDELAASLPGAEVQDPRGLGEGWWLVGRKPFVSMHAKGMGASLRVASKEEGERLLEEGYGEKVVNNLGYWISLPDDIEEDFLRRRILVSYDIVRATLSQETQAALPPRKETV